MRIPSAVWAKIGSLVTAIPIISGQLISQHYEEEKSLRALAYEYAWKEWNAQLDARVEKDLPLQGLMPFRFKLMEHLIYTGILADMGLSGLAKDKGKGSFDILLNEYFEKARGFLPQAHSDKDQPASDDHAKENVNP